MCFRGQVLPNLSSLSLCINTNFFRDSLIDHLYQENGRQRQEFNRWLMEHQQMVADFRNRVLELESTLSAKVSLLYNFKV